MTLAQLGGDDLTRGFLSAVELGRSSISLKALSIVANRLDLPMSYFLNDTATDTDALAELLLDEAETAIRTQRPSDALRIVAEDDEPPNLRSRKLWLHGWALTNLGRAREAIPLLEEAVALSESDGDVREITSAQYILALALWGATNYDEAMIYLRRAHDHAMSQLDDPSLLGKITVAIGHVHYMQGDLESALAQYARARELFDTIRDLDYLAAVYTGLSRIHRQKGDLRAALRYSRLSLGIFEARHNERNAAHELNNMASHYEELGDTDQALATATDAVNRAQGSQSPDIEALARSTLASVFLRLGDVAQARQQAEKSQRLGQSDQDLGSIDALVVLAKIAEQQSETEQADAFYGRALAALESIGLHTRYADVALAYSETLRARGDIEEALEYALTAAKALAARRSSSTR